MKKKICGNCFSPMRGNTCSHCGYTETYTKAEYDSLPVGTRLHNRYTIGRMMDKGGFGIIYLAYDEQYDKTVAVKEFYPDGIAVRSQDNVKVEPMTSQQEESFSTGLQRFPYEAEIISRFAESSEIIGIYDVFNENGTAYYVMEYVNGVALKKYTDVNGAITPGQALYIAGQILPALDIMHREGILHRDVSPDNIMICWNGSVKLIDFGSARALQDKEQSMSVILKQGFAPLEQYQRRGKQGGWTDIYSLGASLYYALTLVTPDDPLTRLDSDEYFTKAIIGVPEPLSEILLKACAVRSENRYQSAGEMLAAVNGCNIKKESFSEERVRAAASSEKPAVRRRPVRKRFIAGGAAVVAAAVASRVAVMLGVGTPEELPVAAQHDPIEVKIGYEMFPITLTSLDLENRELTNTQIQNLSHMSQLKTLNLSNNYITDLSCLAGLTQLEEIHFSNNNVQDISFMKDMTELRNISAENTGVSDISVLSDKTKLEQVFFGDSYVTDISPIKNSRGLRKVGFNEAKLTDIEALSGMTELEMVCFAGCGLKSVEPLRDSKKLRYIYFGRNDLTDLSPFVGCDIEEMYVDMNQLTVQSFKGLKSHGFIVINGNGFTDEQVRAISHCISGEFELYN
ncbi:MAG: leucine-rich repeat domain-containing protein [Oscillospiraceae bacterium]